MDLKSKEGRIFYKGQEIAQIDSWKINSGVNFPDKFPDVMQSGVFPDISSLRIAEEFDGVHNPIPLVVVGGVYDLHCHEYGTKIKAKCISVDGNGIYAFEHIEGS